MANGSNSLEVDEIERRKTEWAILEKFMIHFKNYCVTRKKIIMLAFYWIKKEVWILVNFLFNM